MTKIQGRTLRSRKQAVPVFVLLVVVYAGGIVFGIWMVASTHHRMDTLRPVPGGIVTTGTIVTADKHCSKGCWWDPHIQWIDGHGSVHEFKGVSYSHRPATGATVRVSYDPDNPTIAHEISRDPSILNPPLYTGYAIGATAGILGAITIPLMINKMRKLPWSASPATMPAALAQLPPPPERGVHAALVRQIRAAMIGLNTGAGLLSTFGLLIGLGNHAAWLMIVWLAGVLSLVVGGRTVLAHCRDEAIDAETLRGWWRWQGALTLLASTVPALATIAIAIAIAIVGRR